MPTIFKPLPFDTTYGVSKNGIVKNLKTNKILKAHKIKKGYLRTTLRNKKKYLVHRLVGICFIENPYNKLYINHIDGNKTNNDVSNLKWVTDAENREHAIKNGLWDNISAKITQRQLGSGNSAAKLKEFQIFEILKTFELGLTNTEIAKIYNVSCTAISSIRKGKNWNHITNII